MKLTIILFILVFCSFSPVKSQVSIVKIEKSNAKWSLLVDGRPYYIRGAGGEKNLAEVKAIGGNTIRTWGLENVQSVLDDAQKNGLKVMVGMWVQHERHGFNYNDEEKVNSQLEAFRVAIKKYKNHPALLIWCVGNEYELEYSNTKVWKAVNDIAKMVQGEDENHPVATVTAGTSPEKLKHVMEELTAIDIYGINTYGDIGNVRSVLTDGNFQGAYMITEWGPTGHWESPKTAWGSSIEQTSREKAICYKDRYARFIAADSTQCIGSFAFLWGQKQEYTSSWYGIFHENGSPTETYDALAECWMGHLPKNTAPYLDSVLFNGVATHSNHILKPNQKVEARVFSTDINKDKLDYAWELYPESEDLKSGGDFENKPPLITGRLKSKNAEACLLNAPTKEGRYRLFITVSDGEKVAYANIPFYVENAANANEKSFIQLKKTTLSSFDNE